MNEDSNISREELLELATADAVGAIDEVEAGRFERGFASAAPSVQAEIRALQDRIAGDVSLRSTEVPPTSLRLKVLARVASEMERQAAAPIATIGPARARSSEVQQTLDRESIINDILESSALERRPTQHAWRAAALFLFAALAVTLYFHVQQRETSEQLVELLRSKRVEDSVRVPAQVSATFDFQNARVLEVVDAAGTPSKLIHAFLDESSGRVCVWGIGVGGVAGAHVLVRAEDSGLALGSSVVADNAFAVLFDLPRSGGRLQLEVGAANLTIIV